MGWWCLAETHDHKLLSLDVTGKYMHRGWGQTAQAFIRLRLAPSPMMAWWPSGLLSRLHEPQVVDTREGWETLWPLPCATTTSECLMSYCFNGEENVLEENRKTQTRVGRTSSSGPPYRRDGNTPRPVTPATWRNTENPHNWIHGGEHACGQKWDHVIQQYSSFPGAIYLDNGGMTTIGL